MSCSQVEGLHANDDRGHPAVNGLDLEVRAGEILGVAGVEGNGQREFVEALCGIRPPKGGRVTFEGRDITHDSAHTINRLGVSHIPEDREKHGFVGLLLGGHQPRAGALRRAAVRQGHPPRLRGRPRQRPPSSSTASTSGRGTSTTRCAPSRAATSRRPIVARELTQGARLVIAAQPTRGVDVGSIEFIHRQLVDQRDAGVAVLLVSAELDEVLSLADRVAVIYEGRIQAVMPVAEATRERIGLLMAGADPDQVDIPDSGLNEADRPTL